jgi:WD40 repeat protein/DNA-binding SARP family transcriptional activator
MDFHILGPLEVVDENRVVSVSGSKQQALLALLLVHANETLSADQLIEELRGETPPATANKTLQVHVSRLRKALADGNGTDEILRTRAHGYQLTVDPERVDAHRFEQLVADGRRELAAGQHAQAARTLERALAMWRGAPLGDLAYEPFAAREAERLAELRIGAIEELLDAKLALGRHAEVVAEVDSLIAEHPYRERLRAQKMLALYRSDRQADALQVYQDARVRLVTDLGIEPGERLRRLEQAVLAQDPELLLIPVVAHLPPELRAETAVAGREAELQQLTDAWRHARGGAGRVILLTGAHGIGKSRLASELAVAVHEAGDAVRYEAGQGAAERAAVEGLGRPTLVVLDDVDVLTGLGDAVRKRPVLVVATAVDAVPGAETTLRLEPLGIDAVRAVAATYARDGIEIPAQRLAAASGGNPQRVHQLARAWAHDAATRRVGASVARAEEERSSLRSAEAELADDVVELRALDDVPAADRTVVCPFKGLASFDIEDADVFFGRERLVAEMVARLVGAPLLGIVGPSGSGKSSAMRAGLLAALTAGVLPGSHRWRLRLFRPGEHPLAALGEVAGDGTTIVAVDQFEEAFTICTDDAERGAFVDRLVALGRDPRAVVIVAIRADFYGRCAAYPEFARLLGANHVLVGPMRRDELRAAIESPARRSGLTVDPELVDALIADVEGEPGALPLLSTTLLELWRHRDGRRLRMQTYEQRGGVHGAVARLAESAYERLGDAQREVARRVMLRLAGQGEGDAVVRRRVDLTELEDATEVLSVLAESRLVTIGEGQVEVAHEALLREWPRLRGWLEEDVQGRRLHRHLSLAARDWDARGRDSGDLYRGARLASVLDWAAAHDAELNATEREFVAESRDASERSHRRLRAVLAGVAALLVVAVVAGVVALGQRSKANDEALAADAQKLGASALVESDLSRALLLARQAVALDDTVETRSNLLSTLLKSPAANGVMRAGTQRYWSLALSPDGRTLAAGDEFGLLVLFDVRTRRPVATLNPINDGGAIQDMVYSRDGRYLALSSAPLFTTFGTVTIVDMRRREVHSRLRPLVGLPGPMRFSDDDRVLAVEVADTRFPDPSESYLFHYDVQSGRRLPGRVQLSPYPSPALTTSDGRRMVATGEDGTTIRDATGRRILSRFPEGFNGQDFWTALSPDGRTLVAGGQDGSLHLMDLRTGRTRVASGRHEAAVNRGIVFTPDGRRVITPGDDGAIIVWDTRKADVLERLTGHPAAVRGLAVSHDGRTLYSAGADGNVIVWDLSGQRGLGRPFDAGTENVGFPRYSLSSDGTLLAHGQRDGRVTITDMRTRARLRSFPVTTTAPLGVDVNGLQSPDIFGMRFVPRSHLLVVGGFAGFLAIVDADTGRLLKRLTGHTGALYTPGISDDGRLMITGNGDKTIRFWSLPDGRPLGKPMRFKKFPTDAQLSPDGRWLVVAPQNGAVQIYDARTRKLVHRVTDHEGIYFARFSQDGRLLAVGDLRGRAEVWSTTTWKPITRPFAGLNGVVQLAAISPDNRVLAAGATDGGVRLWDIKTQQQIGTALPGVPQREVIPLFTPDGSALIAAYNTGRAYRWDIRPQSLIKHACQVAGRQLTRAEWEQALPGRDYDPAC